MTITTVAGGQNFKRDRAQISWKSCCMPLAITTDGKTGLPLSIGTTGRKPLSIAVASIVAAYILATTGCIALGIPSKRFHDPQDRGGLLGDFRVGGSLPTPVNAGDGDHFIDNSGHPAPCVEGYCVDACESETPYDNFDDGAGIRSIGRHQKLPDVPWPRYHPVPTRPVFTGYPGL